MAYVSLAIFLLVVAVLWWAAVIWLMSGQLLRPRRMTDGLAMALVKRLSPEDLGLAFTPIGFTVRDAATNGTIRLAAWWMPAAAPSTRTVILLHGYADAKVGVIAWAPTWHALGWHVLAVDGRAHGESEGRDVTAGFYERDDINQVIDALRADKPRPTATLALFGVSLGAAVAAATAARRTDLAAVVLESPFADYFAAIHAHGRRTGMPLEHAFGVVARLAEWRSGARFADVLPTDAILAIAAPLLVIHGDDDVVVDAGQIQRIKVALAARPAGTVTQHVVLPGVRHVLALASNPEAYRERIAAFLHACDTHAAAAPPALAPFAAK